MFSYENIAVSKTTLLFASLIKRRYIPIVLVLIFVKRREIRSTEKLKNLKGNVPNWAVTLPGYSSLLKNEYTLNILSPLT